MTEISATAESVPGTPLARDSGQARVEVREVESPTLEAVREAVAKVLVDKGSTGLTRRELVAAVAAELPGLRSNLDGVLDVLLLLGVVNEDDGRFIATELTDRYLLGTRLAAAGS